VAARASDLKPHITIVRTFDAPRELVWKAWTEPEHLARWFGPKGFTTPVCEADVRAGGTQRVTMRGPDGTDYPMTAIYEEVVPPERLTWNGSVEHAGNVSFDVYQVATFAEHKGKTELTLQAFVTRATPEAAGALGGMEEGWSQSLDKLAALLARR
jgi:uncharacterized protein YndB with AHSA1/START domain